MTALTAGAPRAPCYFAAVAAEEQGLLGSQYLAAHPPVAAGRIAANINIDGINIWGRTRDMTHDRPRQVDPRRRHRRASPPCRAARSWADQFPDRGYFYRSDQFNFAKIGVPAAYLEAGIDVDRQARGLGQGRARASSRRRTTTSPRTSSGTAGT